MRNKNIVLWVSRLFIIIIIFIIVFLEPLGGGGARTGPTKCQLYRLKFIAWNDMKVEMQNTTLSGERWGRVITVDQNGNGDSTTVQGAIDMVPHSNSERVKIHILPGIYREKVLVPASKPYISFIGDDDQKTIITWNNKASDKDERGFELGTPRSASVTIESNFFSATGLTFENSVATKPGEIGRQAVALRLRSDKAMLYKVRILGFQDTLLDESGSHYFYKCFIQGSIDFIFGKSKSLYQECALHSNAKPFGAIAAHHRDSEDEDTGFSFVNCTINGTGTLDLGRAWGEYSRIIYSYCYFHNVISPSGWSDWDQPSRQKTAVFGEYKCRGKGADTSNRVPWLRNFNYEQVRPFLSRTFIAGDQWLRL